MSLERAELMRRTFERWNAGEREIDPEIVHPGLVIHSAVTNTTWNGYEGLRRWVAEFDDQFEDWSLFFDEFRDAPEGRLLALGKIRVRGRTSGVEIDQPMAFLLAFSGERVIELSTFPDHVDALAAAGLSAPSRQSGTTR